MPTFHVTLVRRAQIEVEAEDKDAALRKAMEEAQETDFETVDWHVRPTRPALPNPLFGHR